MANTIKYQIEFFSQWHCGSGLSAGADVDALVVKDADGMPFIPGKTIKGLLKEALEDYAFLAKKNIDTKKCFGEETATKGTAFFSNATLSEEEHDGIVNAKAQQYLYNKVSQTAIDDETGTAKQHSLRRIETVVPCTLQGTISDVPEDIKEHLIKAFGMVKRLGQNRTRGLGRCRITLKEGGEA